MPATPNPSDAANLDPNDPAARQWLNDHTIIFDFSDLPPDDEELAARQSLRKLQQSFRTQRRRKPASTPPPLLPPPPAVASAPEPVQSPAALPPADASAPARQRGGQPGNNNALKYGFRDLPAPRDLRIPEQSERYEDPEPESGSEVREGYTDNIARKRGAQPGNNNALKYGFYSRRMPLRELEGLDQTAVTSLKDEIDVMRVFSRKVAELGAEVEDLSDAKDLLRVMSLATTSINRLVRTHTRIPDPELDPAWLLKTALLELEEEWPELKAFASQFRDKPTSAQPPAQPLP